jgi:hypothetical protein
MFPILADFLATLKGGGLKDGQAIGKTGRGVPVRDSCRAPNCAPRPVRHGKKSGPAEGLQGRSVRGEGRPVAGRAGTGETVALCTYITTS